MDAKTSRTEDVTCCQRRFLCLFETFRMLFFQAALSRRIYSWSSEVRKYPPDLFAALVPVISKKAMFFSSVHLAMVVSQPRLMPPGTAILDRVTPRHCKNYRH